MIQSQKSLTECILLTTKKIYEEFPELIKYLNEIPQHFETQPENEVNNKELENYLNSLNELLKKYAKEQ